MIVQANPGFNLAIAVNADHSDEWTVVVRPIVAWTITAEHPVPIAIDTAPVGNQITSAIVCPDGTIADCAKVGSGSCASNMRRSPEPQSPIRITQRAAQAPKNALRVRTKIFAP
jgi:hypothetical protein